MVGGRHGTRRAGLHRRPAAVPELPGGSPLRVAPGRASRGRRPTAQPEVRGHRPAVPRTAAGRAPRLRGAGARLATRGGLGGSAAAPPGPGRPGGGRPGGSAAGRTVRAARNAVLVRGDDPLDPPLAATRRTLY